MASLSLLSAARDQPLNMTLFDNTTVTLTVGDFDDFALESIQTCINYATQLGCSAMLLIIMALVTKPERRKTAMFSLNALALLINFFRNLLLILFFTSPFNETYVYFSGDYGLVPASSYSASCASVLMTLFLLIVVEVCLILQTQVVLITLPRLYRRGMLTASVLVAAAVIGLRICYTVINIRAILAASSDANFDHFSDVMNIVTMVSICWFSIIFTIKLGFAILNRRKMGLQSFGPMDILFVMGGQTMLVPGKSSLPSQTGRRLQVAAIVSIIWYFSNVPSFSSWILTITAIFLPLSSLWAASIIDGWRSRPQPNVQDNSYTLGSTTLWSASNSSGKHGSKSKPAMLFKQPFGGRRNSSFSTNPTTAVDPILELRNQRTLGDLEKQGL